MLQSTDHFYGPPLDLLEWVHVLMLGAPELDTALQGVSHESGAEGENITGVPIEAFLVALDIPGHV